MRIAVIGVTESSLETGLFLSEALPDCVFLDERGKGRLKGRMEVIFREYEGLIFLMASGIVVRMIAPCLESKHRDPAVVAVDDAKRYAVSLLSGHEGGANGLAARVAAVLNAEPVITTASETNRRFILGVGCRKGCPAGEIREAAESVIAEAGITWDDIRTGASVELKMKEPGLLELFAGQGIPLRFFSTRQINCFKGPFAESEAAMRNIGAKAVAEPCALLAGRRTSLIIPKRIIGRVTLALAKEES